MHADERLQPREGMRERQEEEVDVSLGDRGGLRRRVQRRDVIAMRLHHALGRSGGARGVDDGGDVVGPAIGHPGGQLALHLVLIVPPQPAQLVPGLDERMRLAGLVALQHHDLLEPVHLPLHLEHLGELGRILHEKGLHPRVVDDVLDEVRRIGRIDGNGDAARGKDGEVGLDPLGAASREDAHRVALLPPQRDEAAGQLADAVADVLPGQRAPGAVALDLLGGARRRSIHPAPEQSRERVIRHGYLLTPVCGALCAGSSRMGLLGRVSTKRTCFGHL